MPSAVKADTMLRMHHERWCQSVVEKEFPSRHEACLFLDRPCSTHTEYLHAGFVSLSQHTFLMNCCGMRTSWAS